MDSLRMASSASQESLREIAAGGQQPSTDELSKLDDDNALERSRVQEAKRKGGTGLEAGEMPRVNNWGRLDSVVDRHQEGGVGKLVRKAVTGQKSLVANQSGALEVVRRPVFQMSLVYSD